MKLYLKALEREIILLKKLGYSKKEIRKVIIKKVDKHFGRYFHETSNSKEFYGFLRVKYNIY